MSRELRLCPCHDRAPMPWPTWPMLDREWVRGEWESWDAEYPLSSFVLDYWYPDDGPTTCPAY
jgi:hypothetical protein